MDSLFGEKKNPAKAIQGIKSASLFSPSSEPEVSPVLKTGDMIGRRYEVQEILGKGGFGLVYLVYDCESKSLCALKTFRDEFLADSMVREEFRREASLWIDLGEHPFIVPARWAEEVSGRLFVEMDYIRPDSQGRITLADHLAVCKAPLDTDLLLKWGIQFCAGMEHANALGIQSHRDIKPANILIGRDGVLKITDFGLAAAIEAGSEEHNAIAGSKDRGFGLSLFKSQGKRVCGTPGYIAPEVYQGKRADVRSDIYGFGVVLWQMAAGAESPPFKVVFTGDIDAYLEAIYCEQRAERVDSVCEPLETPVKKCLAFDPSDRTKDISKLRQELESLLFVRTGLKIEIPKVAEQTAAFWSNKGGSLTQLGRLEEALLCYDKALEIDSRRVRAWGGEAGSVMYIDGVPLSEYAQAWSGKGVTLAELDRHKEAITCFDRALETDPENEVVLSNKGASLEILGRLNEALVCYDRALESDQEYAVAWARKGSLLFDLKRSSEAVTCYNRALQIDPRFGIVWANKGIDLAAEDRNEEAIVCFKNALEIDPRNWKVWGENGIALAALGRYEEAIRSFEKAHEINPKYPSEGWCHKGVALANLERHKEAILAYNKALEIDPRNAVAWGNKGFSLAKLGLGDESILCLDRALEIEPFAVSVWNNKAYMLLALGRREEAAICRKRAVEIEARGERLS
ncbi:MAG: serine/threonine-protein kinase [FCB group bacterium]|nr:serine/threonine-protein kinase [FCB group bacterium]